MHEEQTTAAPAEETLDVSPASSAADVTDASSAPDVTDASSAPDGKQAEPDLLSVVKSAVEKDKPSPEAPSAPETEAGKDADQTDKGNDLEGVDDGSDLQFGKHPRFQALVHKTKRLQSEVRKLEEPARQHGQIVEFMRANDLSDDHMVELFRVGALMRKDPDKAYEAVADYLLELGKITGRSLPDDIREDVDYGRISEERAQELARQRAKAARLEAERTERDERGQTAAVQSRRENIQRTVTEWEAQTRATDPDYRAKEKLIADRVQVLAQRQGLPRNSDEALALAKRAHKEVSEELKAVLPRRQQIARPPQSSGSSAQAAAAPKTLQEAINAAIQR